MGLNITDEKLRNSVDRFFEKLAKYFPERKVFALDSIDKDLRERLSELYKKAGCTTAEEFLLAYGFEIISGEDVRKIRSFVLYTPGNEPEIIKGKVDNMLRRLHEYYPDAKISRGLQNDHKSLSKSVSGLYQWLGYESANEMLSAYGFDVQYADSGRPSNDHQGLIALLQEKYKNGNKPKSLGLLIHDNPEYTGQLKTLSNRANELFGMTLAKYFKEVGILGISEGSEGKTQADKKKYYHYFLVSVEGIETTIPCATDTRTVHEGDYIEMCRIHDNVKTIGVVSETCYYTEEKELPCPVEEMQQYIRKLLKSELKEIEASKEKYIFCSVQLQNRYDSLYYLSPFDDIEVGDVVAVPHNWYGMTTGVVTEVFRASEKTAPYPVKKTKKIAYITVQIRAEKEKSAATIEKIAADNETKAFMSCPIDSSVTAKYQRCTYFASAVFRGLETDVREALRIIYPASFNSFAYRTQLCEGVAQFECDSSFVPRILKEFPNLKGVFFAEDWKGNAVYLAYSESGYDTVTSYRFLGKCNFYERDRWSLIHDPAEKEFSFDGGQYAFTEIEQWEKYDYVLAGGMKQLASKITIPSQPYKKETTNTPSQIIEIRFPENEQFYTPPQPNVTVAPTEVGSALTNINGKIFVVTGDLNRYSSRDELRAIIESAGGKLTGSVSTKTTALITNFPNSGTTKIRKAIECGVEIISEDVFIERYMTKRER